MNDTATQQGAARQEPPKDPDVKANEVAVQTNPRQAALDAMADRQEADRRKELDDALAADPGLRHQQDQIDQEIAQANAEAGIRHEEHTPTYGNDGAASRQALNNEPEPARPDLPSNLQDDPMADFIVMNNGSPMVKAKVNGEDRPIPLADAKRQGQIGVAAEMRMQAAAEAEKNIQAREAKLTAGEAALSARMKTMQSQPTVPVQDLTDEELEKEAIEIFETAFSGTEEDAAKKLAKTLAKIRSSAVQQPTPQVDPREIARQAASMAVGTLSEQSRKKDMGKAFQAFKADYPEILKDPNLFKMADDLTDQLEREHPDWDIAQVMDEAGKRTQAWVKGLRGESRDTQAPAPGGQNSPVSDSTTQTRQERKAGLVRMPSAAASATYQQSEESDEQDQSPQDAFLELKKARGQPV